MEFYWDTIHKLGQCFSGSFINTDGKFIVKQKGHMYSTYFDLTDCKTEFDIKCKVLEYCSYAACKAKFYSSPERNQDFQDGIRHGINQFLDTNFSAKDMERIYTYLGNGNNPALTKRFIESGYDTSILMSKDQYLLSACDKSEDWEMLR